MPQETIRTLIKAAHDKAELLARSPGQYLALSALAGVYVEARRKGA